MSSPDNDLEFTIVYALRSLDPWPRANDLSLPSRRLAKAVAEHLKRCGYVITKGPPAPPPSMGRFMGGNS